MRRSQFERPGTSTRRLAHPTVGTPVVGPRAYLSELRSSLIYPACIDTHYSSTAPRQINTTQHRNVLACLPSGPPCYGMSRMSPLPNCHWNCRHDAFLLYVYSGKVSDGLAVSASGSESTKEEREEGKRRERRRKEREEGEYAFEYASKMSAH